MKIGHRFFVRALVLAATAGIGAGALAAPTSEIPHCQICLVIYQTCVNNGGGMDKCEDVLDQCRATQCSSAASAPPLDRKGEKVTGPAMLASVRPATRG